MSSVFHTRGIEPSDYDWIVALNQVHVQATAPMDLAGLQSLLSECAFTCIAEEQAGFVLCMDHTSTDEGPNFNWFKSRYDQFLYVDRIVVDLTKNQKGTGRAIYAQVFAEASRRGLPLVCAEVNTDPPNPVSIAFHEKQGFETAGEAFLPDRGKTVRYFTRAIASS